MTLKQARLIIEHELSEFSDEVTINNEEECCSYVVLDNKIGMMGVKDSKLEFVVCNMAYLNYLMKEGFEMDFILQNERVWLTVTDVDEFIRYIKGEKFKFIRQ